MNGGYFDGLMDRHLWLGVEGWGWGDTLMGGLIVHDWVCCHAYC